MHSTTKYYFQCLALLAAVLTIALGPAAAQADGLYFNQNFMLYNKVQGGYCQHNCTSSAPCLTACAAGSTASSLFLLTNSQSSGSDYVVSPSLPSILSGGSYSNWCFPKNATGFPSDAQMCNGAPNYN